MNLKAANQDQNLSCAEFARVLQIPRTVFFKEKTQENCELLMAFIELDKSGLKRRLRKHNLVS